MLPPGHAGARGVLRALEAVLGTAHVAALTPLLLVTSSLSALALPLSAPTTLVSLLFLGHARQLQCRHTRCCCLCLQGTLSRQNVGHSCTYLTSLLECHLLSPSLITLFKISTSLLTHFLFSFSTSICSFLYTIFISVHYISTYSFRVHLLILECKLFKGILKNNFVHCCIPPPEIWHKEDMQ